MISSLKGIKIQNLGANKLEIYLDKSNLILFQSYETIVAARLENLEYVRTSTKWSRTTTRHINKWLEGVEAKERPQSFFDKFSKLLKK